MQPAVRRMRPASLLGQSKSAVRPLVAPGTAADLWPHRWNAQKLCRHLFIYLCWKINRYCTFLLPGVSCNSCSLVKLLEYASWIPPIQSQTSVFCLRRKNAPNKSSSLTVALCFVVSQLNLSYPVSETNFLYLRGRGDWLQQFAKQDIPVCARVFK